MEEGQVLGNFRLLERIRTKHCGRIYMATDMETEECVEIKLEPVNTIYPTLLFESKLYEKLYRNLQGRVGIPRIRWFGAVGDYNILETDLMGPSLELLLDLCSRKFSLKTILMLADQMINLVEFVHSNSYLHLNIRPDKFVVGLKGLQTKQLYIMDFSHAKRYRDPTTQQHVPYSENRKWPWRVDSFLGTNTHRGIELSRRDDLESLGYVLMYLLRGSLPWQRIPEGTLKELIARKMSTSVEELCHGYPAEFASYLQYCMSLGFDERPDYSYLRGLFHDLFVRQGFQHDNNYDWNYLRRPFTRAAPAARSGAGQTSGLTAAVGES